MDPTHTQGLDVVSAVGAPPKDASGGLTSPSSEPSSAGVSHRASVDSTQPMTKRARFNRPEPVHVPKDSDGEGEDEDDDVDDDDFDEDEEDGEEEEGSSDSHASGNGADEAQGANGSLRNGLQAFMDAGGAGSGAVLYLTPKLPDADPVSAATTHADHASNLHHPNPSGGVPSHILPELPCTPLPLPMSAGFSTSQHFFGGSGDGEARVPPTPLTASLFTLSIPNFTFQLPINEVFICNGLPAVSHADPSAQVADASNSSHPIAMTAEAKGAATPAQAATTTTVPAAAAAATTNTTTTTTTTTTRATRATAKASAASAAATNASTSMAPPAPVTGRALPAHTHAKATTTPNAFKASPLPLTPVKWQGVCMSPFGAFKFDFSFPEGEDPLATSTSDSILTETPSLTPSWTRALDTFDFTLELDEHQAAECLDGPKLGTADDDDDVPASPLHSLGQMLHLPLGASGRTGAVGPSGARPRGFSSLRHDASHQLGGGGSSSRDLHSSWASVSSPGSDGTTTTVSNSFTTTLAGSQSRGVDQPPPQPTADAGHDNQNRRRVHITALTAVARPLEEGHKAPKNAAGGPRRKRRVADMTPAQLQHTRERNKIMSQRNRQRQKLRNVEIKSRLAMAEDSNKGLRSELEHQKWLLSDLRERIINSPQVMAALFRYG